MKRRSILQWLEAGCPYLSGVELYRQVGGDYPISYFLGYENASFVPDTIERRLEYALRIALQTLPDDAPEIPSLQTGHAEVANNIAPSANPAPIEPAPIQQLRAEAKELHKRQAYLHAQLSIVERQEVRAELVVEIMETVIPRLDAIYDHIRGYEDTGELPTAAPNNRDGYIIERMLRRNSLKSRISKIKSLLKKAMEDVAKAKLKNELLEKQVELQGIEVEFSAYL